MTLIHLGTQSLETSRLILCKFTSHDAEDMYQNWANDPLVSQYTSWETHADVQETQSILAEWIEGYKAKNFYNWAIFLKKAKKLIGSIGVVQIDEISDSIDIGYCISREFWRQNITSEALAKVLQFFFEEVQVHRIEAIHHIDNLASGKVMEKNGFIQEGAQRESFKNADGSFGDMVLRAILKSDWEKFQK